MRPLALPPNQLHRFYRGGARIAELRGTESTDDHAPEDWVGATNPAYGSDDDGLSRFADGRLVRDAVRTDPGGFLGAEHVERFGADPGLLVKLLDAGERLPVHLHPRRAFARRHLGSAHGKTEAWVVVSAAEGATVHVGFRDEVDRDTLRAWVENGDGEALLAALVELPVAPGDAIFVPAGTPHAIGEGILLVELQEPTDFSVLLEQPAGAADAELGLGWDVALEAVDLGAFHEDRLRTPALLPPAADAYFRAEWLRPDPAAELDAGFSILVVLEGEGELSAPEWRLPVRRGETLLVPHAAGATALRGELHALRCRPADPSAPEGEW